LIIASQFIFSRAMLALTLLVTPYARGKTGIAAPFAQHRPLRRWGLILSIILLYNLAALACGHLLLGILITAASLPCWLFLWFCQRKLAGITGDCLGAVNEIYEIAYLITALLTIALTRLPLPVYS
jgi:adenosylcobinamide-GDP ribazoletransferase